MEIKTLISDIKNGTSHSLEYLLSNNVEETLSTKGIKIRKLIAPIMRKIYKSQSEYKFVLDKREPLSKSKTGKIFIVNHRQGDDMVFSATAVGRSGYFVFGNPVLACEKSINGFGLWCYGMILVKRNDKASRAAAIEKMKYVLKNKGNIIIFPEGYWNLDDDGTKDEKHKADDHNSESWLIQDINIGSLRVAQELGCEIVPTILHYDEIGKMKCYAKRGKTFKISKSDNIFTKKDEILDYMNTSYFDLMEKYSDYNRNDLEQNGITLKEQWELLKKKLISACDIPNANYVLDLQDEKLIGKAKVVKNITTNDDAFEHLNNINYKKRNAYLLSRKLKGKR